MTNHKVAVMMVEATAVMMNDDNAVCHGRDRRESDGRSQDDRRNNFLQHRDTPLFLF